MTNLQALSDLAKRLELLANTDIARIAIEIENHIGYLIERHPNVDPNILRLSFITNLTKVLVDHQKFILNNLKK